MIGEEIKSPNRAEKRPIDSTLAEDSLLSSGSTCSGGGGGGGGGAGGLQVTGAPVPLFAAQEVSMSSAAGASIGVQVQSSTLAATACAAALTFQPLGSVALPCSAHSGHTAQVPYFDYNFHFQFHLHSILDSRFH